MIFRKKIQVIKPILYMNSSIIDSVKKFNFLELVLRSNLKWNCHIDHISRKISRAIGVIHALNVSLSFLYNALILPYFNYYLLVWSAKTSSLLSLQYCAYTYKHCFFCSYLCTFQTDERT